MSNTENIPPQVSRRILKELQKLTADPPDGIKIVFRENDLTDIVAYIEGPEDTPYAGGVFRVRLSVCAEYPSRAPRATFLTRVFHPNVSARGAVCVDTLARGWRPELGLQHAVLSVRALLSQPNAESALDAEAARLLSDPPQFERRARLLTRLHAQSHITEQQVQANEEQASVAAKRERRRMLKRL